MRLPHIRHILLALLNDPVLVSRIMEGISEKEILETINAHLPRSEPTMLPHALPLSREAREALVLAEAEADKLGHRYIRNEQHRLGPVESGNSFAAELLTKKGLSARETANANKGLAWLRRQGKVTFW